MEVWVVRYRVSFRKLRDYSRLLAEAMLMLLRSVGDVRVLIGGRNIASLN